MAKIALLSLRDTTNEHGNHIDTIEGGYVPFLEKRDYLVVPISNTTGDARKYLSLNPDLVVFSGGNISDERDKVEKALYEEAVERGIPVLGICHGLEWINMHYGGSSVDTEKHSPKYKVQEHEVSVDLGGVKGTYTVNTYHNKKVTRETLGKGLEVFATSPDGAVEGLKHPEHKVLAIQWHPERDLDKEVQVVSKAVLDEFLGEAA